MDTANKPMYEWETINWSKTQRLVFKLQKRIYRASERGDVKAVRRLQRLLTKSWNAKAVAVRKVTQDNQGKNTPGVDGVSRLRNHQKIHLANNLNLSDKSQPTKRVWIPKPGSGEMRPLGIPTMKERAKQALLKLALEPEWEAKFEPNSYGFRPGRSCHDAITAIYNGIVQKPKYVLDADIEKCFDRINHKKLLDKLNTTPTFRRQIRAWLKSGVMDGKTLFPTEEGTPQGGVISPLLANIALHGIEEMLTKNFSRRTGKTSRKRKPSFVRYADDFVLMDESLEVVLEAKQLIETWLSEMGLVLKESKTRITHTFMKYEEKVGFDFLGFHIRQYPCSDKQSGSVGGTERKRGYKTFIRPSKEAIKRHLNKIDDLLERNGKSSQEQVINALNPVIRGWAAYYSTVASSHTFNNMDSILYQKLFAWAKKRKNRGQNNTELVSNYWGVNRGLGWKFMTPDNEYVLERYRDTHIKRHVKIKGERSPYDGDLTYWSNRLAQHPMLRHVVAKLLIKQEKKCSECHLMFTSEDIMEVHHIDQNRGNNKLSNLTLVHRHCHDIIHARGTHAS
ncbi:MULTISPECIES: group II intron reverse transcriptase/maturase [unclassified Tolypothrix]|nr:MULTISPECIES: group II intron reverse transcriptase/maturase [unclassified Tolypothrix]BAY91823.1 RNA-directed DNA polymerase [Microchaete diplosiphon NIES-3275]EKF05024.1 RNA-directed DNA polymerase [Tolypothrix sp. PCC 7601]MBE9081232.1 group II intron reverse transcriptase/maturase [Tolypothrix sp. LEGE 11397]UYD25834.1 group II intron reverse transcriptase/maturase [Tolypothrix sp. PCC 7712]UYD31925.1 group II intron reverse transcriptase/maturase [Tolypothrix sp. PCC 7601]